MNPGIQVAPTVDAANPWAMHAVRILAIRREVPQAFTYELAFEDHAVGERFRFRPGQFDMLYLPGIGESAISISSDPDDPQRLLHTIRAVGNVTRALARKRVGDQLLLRGPFGSAWPVESCEGQDLVIAAGGLGLACSRAGFACSQNASNMSSSWRSVECASLTRLSSDNCYHVPSPEMRDASILRDTPCTIPDEVRLPPRSSVGTAVPSSITVSALLTRCHQQNECTGRTRRSAI